MESSLKDLAGIWIEPGMSRKADAVIRKLAPQAMKEINKRGWEASCQEAARYWMHLLEKQGIKSRYVDGHFAVDFDLYASGEYDDDWLEDIATPHTWLVIGGKIFDSTAGQFASDSRIFPITIRDITSRMYIED